MAMSRARDTIRAGGPGLLGAILAAAASHDLESVRTQAALRKALEERSPALPTDIGMLLDGHRRALTGLCAALEPAARSRVEELAPFAKQLIETAAIAALDDRGLDEFLRPIFEEAGLADRFVLAPLAPGAARVAAARSGVEGDAAHVPAITRPAVELVPVTLGAEALFDHLLAHRETISYGSAYRGMLGPWIGPWRSLIHVPMVLQVARGTAERSHGDIKVRLDSLIVNKKTRRPGGRHFGEHPEYAEESWLEHFGRWSACDHTAADIRAGVQAPRPRPAEHPTPPGSDHGHASILTPPVGDVLEIHDSPVEDVPRVRDPIVLSPPPVRRSHRPEVAAAPVAPVPDALPEVDEGPASAVEVQEPPSTRSPGAPPDVALPGGHEAAALPLVVDAPPTEVAAIALPGPAAPAIESEEQSARPRPAPGVRSGRRLAANGRKVLEVAGACVAAIVLGSLVGSVIASQSARPAGPVSEGRAGAPLAVNDTFAALPLGSDPGWDTSGPGGPAGSVRVDPLPTSVDRSLRVQAGAAGQPFSACRAIPKVSGPLLVEARILVDGLAPSDMTIASVRSGADELVGLRLSPEGKILGTADAGTRAGAAAIAPGAWYDLSLQLDTTSRTYHMIVSRADPPASVIAQDGGWKRPLDGVDRICFTPPFAAQSVYINQLRVTAP